MVTASQIPQFSDSRYLDRLSGITYEPIFILGDARSGTSLLHHLLASTKRFNYVKAYHVIKYDEIISNFLEEKEPQAIYQLSTQFATLQITDRDNGGLPVNPETPEEFGLILQNAGFAKHLTSNNYSLFNEACKKIVYTALDPSMPLLLKEPNCFSSFLEIQSLEPQAKMIFLHRHPLNIISSKIIFSRNLLSKRLPYVAMISRKYRDYWNKPFLRLIAPWFFKGLLGINPGVSYFTREYIRSAQYFIENIKYIPESNYISVRYEDLCSDPHGVLKSILDFAGIYSYEVTPIASMIRNNTSMLIQDVDSIKEKLLPRLEPYLSYFNYLG
jgi:hypothetical protein